MGQSLQAIIGWNGEDFLARQRLLPEEAAVALSINGSTHAVMMATPADLHDFAVGLAMNERIITSPEQIERLDIEEAPTGVDCRLWLAADLSAGYVARRRQMTGPAGCGLCGVESLELANVALPQVHGGVALTPEKITRAMAAMAEGQVLGHQTRAVHAAAFHQPDRGMVVVREDVGRHNALDKVAGHLARNDISANGGFLTITSRVSVELIQKAAMMGCGLIAAISVPTQLAVQLAHQAGITLVAVVRGSEFEVFSHPRRIVGAGGQAYSEASQSSARS
ncbi:formate dehydrogenase accessory sulfurtransferase FdhD [Aureimonas fodinaquatilis]|uniref:Sulfur carrier protein FdhD n=1 Tax=Aureimonas fodinaquatilis TaxID=2565783 RepID=A0A5B0E3J8_9HYPH|nr:formate dehydrogenase accessory sulfurtransferase FdhD [Aureimonas fodinaquatilis]KAA0972511.1 formate dehydrogenase accessory sulfurtransferase FdhD [Aureimonas fodinaquatilis]